MASADATGVDAAALGRAPIPARHWGLILGLTLIHLVTSINKPPHIDDTLYLETARGILKDPLRPLCNTVNWEMIPRPIYTFAVNPPLYNYQQAGLIALFGWNVAVLHVLAACYVFVAGLSVYWLARRFTDWPAAALLLFMSCPTLLPQTNLMLDTPGMALVAAAVAAWVKGIDEGSRRWMLISSLAATAALWTKYNSAVALPLILLYALLRRRWWAAFWLLVPLTGLGLWRLHNYFYLPGGVFHLSVAQQRFETGVRVPYQQVILSLMSWGTAFFFLPALAVWSWSRGRRTMSAVACLGAAALFAVEAALAIGPTGDPQSGLHAAAAGLARGLGFGWFVNSANWRMPHWPEQLVFVGNALVIGVFIAVTCVSRWRPWRERWHDCTVCDDVFLLAWLVGMSLFNCLFAPHHTPRYYFPAYPALPLLLVRGVCLLAGGGGAGAAGKGKETRHGPAISAWTRRSVWASVAVQGVVALILAGSDYTFAAASRDFAARLAADPRVAGRPLRYVGHWGFQYHAQQQANFQVVDVREPPPPVGGLVAVVMDTGWGEFPWWLKAGVQGRESFATDMPLWREIRRRVLEERQPKERVQRMFGIPNARVMEQILTGAVQPGRFRVLEDWDVPHPWPLQTIHLANKFLLYSPRFYHNRLPYGRAAGRSHRLLLLQRES